MNIYLDNLNLSSNSGPNSFGRKLIKYMEGLGHTFDAERESDVALAFIQANKEHSIPLIQRLDGIYFNTAQNYKVQNYFIEETYKRSAGAIFQSNFNKDLVFEFFGSHENYTVIHNGADVESIGKSHPICNDRFSETWCCASSWRPHKRLDENIRYFLEHAPEDACFLIAGEAHRRLNHPRVFYLGTLQPEKLYSLYKSSTHFVHLAWLDHCPNVVVDARACGCQIICSSSGGTKEIAGNNAIVIEEEEWDFKPINLYEPPTMDFTRKVENTWSVGYDMNIVAEKYFKFMEECV